jgi:hypothetical protein
VTPPPPCSGGAVTITTSVRLTSNYTCAQVDVLGTPTSVTTINLAGFTLTGTITVDEPAKVLNGTVAGSFTGDLGGGPALTLSQVRVTGDVGRTLWASNLTIGYSEVDGVITADGRKNVINHSLILGGIRIDDVISGVSLSITNNWITGTGSGISIDDEFLEPDIGGSIGGNVVWKVGGPGMALGLGTDLAQLKISNNLLIDNAGDGITLGPSGFPAGGSATFKGNTAIGNTGHGFNLQPTAPDTVVNGGNNVATGNLTSPQCVGIACNP